MTCDSLGVLAIFSKTPGLTPAKTRLGADLGQEMAEHFFRLCLNCQFELTMQIKNSGLSLQAVWTLAEKDSRQNSFWQTENCLEQGSGSLGDRLYSTQQQLSSYHHFIFIGTDSPQLPFSLIKDVHQTLQGENYDFVLGRSLDGGFYLLGSRLKLELDEWNSVPFSHADTSDCLLQLLQSKGRVLELSTLTDVDFKEDLPILYQELSQLAERNTAQNTLLSCLQTVATTGI